MKKKTLLLVLCMISLKVFSQQEEPKTFRPLQGDKTIGFNFVGLNALAINSPVDPLNNAQMVDFRYFFKDDMAFRIGLGIRTQNTTTNTANDNSGGQPLVETETKNSVSGFTIGFGAEKHIKTKSRSIDPFLGASLGISNLGKNVVTTTTNRSFANGNHDLEVNKTTNPGAFAFALSANLGFYWFFTQNVALGGEISLGFATGKQGGEVTVDNSNTSTVGGVSSSSSSSTKTKNEVVFTGIQTLNAGAVELLIKF